MNKRYSVGNWKYILLVGASVVLLLLGYFGCGREQLDLRSLVINIGCGLLASSVVAWLIDGMNVRSKNDERQILFKTTYAGLKCNLFELLAAPACYYNEKIKKTDEEKPWNAWLEMVWEEIIKISSEEERIKAYNSFIGTIKERAEGLREASLDIKNMEYLLRINHLIDGPIYCSVDRVYCASHELCDMQFIDEKSDEKNIVVKRINEVNWIFDCFKEEFAKKEWKEIESNQVDATAFNSETYWDKLISDHSYLNEKKE